jgi:hypothetical protein
MVVTFFQNQAACIAIKKKRLGNTFSSEWHARHPLAVCRHKQAQFRQYVLPTTRYPSCLFGSSSYNTCSTPYYFAQQSISLACHRLSVLYYLDGAYASSDRLTGRANRSPAAAAVPLRAASKTCQGDRLPSPVIKLPCWPLQSIPVLVCCTGHCCVAPSYEKSLQKLRNDNAMGRDWLEKRVETEGSSWHCMVHRQKF